MRYIDGLDNHENLEELLEKAETRIKENSLDEAMTHMRKAVEYMVQQFVRENPDCSGNDLSEMMHNLEGAGILKKGDANILHQIRRKGTRWAPMLPERKLPDSRQRSCLMICSSMCRSFWMQYLIPAAGT